jgi:hypothetical protein
MPPDFGHSLQIEDPVCELNCALKGKWEAQFEVIRTLTLANVGGSKEYR